MRRLFLLLLLIIIAAGACTAYILLAPYKGFSGTGVIVDIPKGDSVRGIARLLEQQGVIRSRYSFIILARRYSNRKLEAGEYYFTSAATPSQIFDTIAAGRIFEVSITVPEGFNTLQVAELLSQNGLVDKDEFIAATKDISSIRDFAPAAPSVEGFLFPSTYEFPHHVSGQEVIATMTAHFRAEWASLTAADPSADGRSVQQIVTLASLVETETPKASERPLVARVFLNRLKIGLPMQCDPTVIYALELAHKYSPPLTGADLRYDSAYNTYRHSGLPPGPITNPGEGSLRAALEPAAVDYLYFVADTQGGHLFSSTLAEHNRNVARYRQLLSQQNGKSPASSHRP